MFDKDGKTRTARFRQVPYLREINDAIYLIALAAEKAGSNDSTRFVTLSATWQTRPGTVVGPGTGGWQAAVKAIAAGEDVNYEGAAGSVDLDENGDVFEGAILIWQIKGEAIEVTDQRSVDLTAEEAAAMPVS